MNEMNWDDLRLFLAIARHGGLAGAARETGASAPTLGRRMVALEARLGAELFERHARGYALTPEGEALVEKVERAEAEIAPLAETRQLPLVKISAGSWMTWYLCRHAAQIDTGQARIRFISADHRLDIARREAVIGIRNTRPEQVGLAARRVGEVRFGVFGSEGAPWAAVDGPTPSAAWVAAQEGARIEVNNPRSALDLAMAGAARAVLPTFVGEAHGLKLLHPVEALRHDQWIVSHDEARHTGAVRAVLRAVGRIVDGLGQGGV
ncbi:MAG: LysR family transcriptional regulator [Pseudomonadota bacterium]